MIADFYTCASCLLFDDEYHVPDGWCKVWRTHKNVGDDCFVYAARVAGREAAVNLYHAMLAVAVGKMASKGLAFDEETAVIMVMKAHQKVRKMKEPLDCGQQEMLALPDAEQLTMDV